MIFISKICNPFGIKGYLQIWSVWMIITFSSLFGLTAILWVMMRQYNPSATPMTHFWQQSKFISINFLLLSFVQATWDCLTTSIPFSKITAGNPSPMVCVRDAVCWMFCFELGWYTQHRLMHDVKFLWINGHAFHHSWRRPEHMIGITNFAFDHVIEVWATMSCSFFGYLIFPTNFFVGKASSLAYMVLAVLSHWDGFGLSRYHINHHYLVTKNYGSHIPLFDVLFDTYQWENYEHPDSARAAAKAAHQELKCEPVPRQN